jgi:hypothetical protein
MYLTDFHLIKIQQLRFQFDSPGFSAAYCFYSLMDESGMVVAFYVATKSMVEYSALMGKCCVYYQCSL